MNEENPNGVGRRELLQGLLGGVGASLSLPLAGEAHPLHEHLQDPARIARATEKAKAPAGKPEFLDAHAFETLTSLAERILPGSTKAGVARFIDSLLAVDTTDRQRQFLSALGAIEAESRSRFGHPWKALSEAQQIELLTAASTMASSQEQPPWTPGSPIIQQRPAPGPPTLRDQFDHIKRWVSGAYFSSEAGMKELGFTGQMYWTSFPGCTHEGGHR